MIETIDVTKPETLDRTVGNVVEKWGRVDCLMNNAALYGDMIKKGWDEITFEEFEMMMDINITGTFNCIKAVFPVMKKQGAGNIINISTSLILFGPLNLSHYSCSKGGVVGLTRAMALELGQYGIRVNAIAPGLVQSQATNDLTSQAYIDLTLRLRCIKELVQPEGMTGAAVFLMSPASRAIVGQNIIVDGGVMFS
jgi:NAD(P)-dependent dehydrogenase (short-subunit alcohol dehydrogenase family)